LIPQVFDLPMKRALMYDPRVLTASRRIDLAPNCSLSPAGAALCFASLCAVTFGLAGVLALKGFWPVLPFAGGEMLLLAWALRAGLKRRGQGESIVVSESQVAIESHLPSRHATVVFPRHWAQVRLRGARSPLHPSSLTIESHGRRCEIGSYLTEEERRTLARRLQSLIGRVADSPPLPSDPVEPE
jgi:uncharacterized membrane protein